MRRLLSLLLPLERFPRDDESRFAYASTVMLWSLVCALVCVLAALIEFTMGGASGMWLLVGALMQVAVMIRLHYSARVEEAANFQVAAQMLWAGSLILASQGELVGIVMLLPFLAFMAVIVLKRTRALAWIALSLVLVVTAHWMRQRGMQPMIDVDRSWIASAIVRVPILLTLLSTAAGLFFVHNYRNLVAAVLRSRERERGLARAHARVNQRLKLVADSVPAAITYIDQDLRYQFNNQVYERWYGRPLSEITGRPLADVMGERNFAVIEPFLRRALQGERVQFEVKLERGRDQDERFLRGSYAPEHDEHGEVIGVVGMLQDVTRLELANREIKRMATQDGLTELANRYVLHQHLNELLGDGQATHRVGLLYLDLDEFKRVNDRHGHASGDEVLVAFGRRIKSCVRAGDLVARLAGDEFVVVLAPHVEPQLATFTAARIRRAMEPPIRVSGGALRISTCIGMAISQPGDTVESLLKRADDALYAEKRSKAGAGQGGDGAGTEKIGPE